jgi:N-acetylmuramoyl-L-alanine amidase
MQAKALTRVLGAGLLFSLASCAMENEVAIKDTSRTFTTVVVDAGHGGRDSGAIRHYGPPEKVVALDVARRVNEKLRESQLRTVMTRDSDVFIPLDERVNIENAQKNAIFVSIHFNDSRRGAVHGFETYYHSPASYALAQRIEEKLSTLEPGSNRGVHAANFRVLRNAVYPAVLVECGFLSNRRDGHSASRADHRDYLADKIAEAIVEARYGPRVYEGPMRTAAARQSNDNTTRSGGGGSSPWSLSR